jgi:hypothetical protein
MMGVVAADETARVLLKLAHVFISIPNEIDCMKISYNRY